MATKCWASTIANQIKKTSSVMKAGNKLGPKVRLYTRLSQGHLAMMSMSYAWLAHRWAHLLTLKTFCMDGHKSTQISTP